MEEQKEPKKSKRGEALKKYREKVKIALKLLKEKEGKTNSEIIKKKPVENDLFKTEIKKDEKIKIENNINETMKEEGIHNWRELDETIEEEFKALQEGYTFICDKSGNLY